MRPPLAGLTVRGVGRELLAGVTLLALAVPLNIGYAQIAGLPATAGLYALVVPTIVYVLFVSSRQLVASPDAAIAALVASSVGGLAIAGDDYATLALAQAVIVGVLFVLLAVFRLGFLASFLSAPILVGFVAGLALDILVGQIAKMLGISLPSGAEFFERVGRIVLELPRAEPWSVAVAVSSILVMLLGRRFLPVVPWALVVLVAATAVVSVAGLAERGVPVLGPVPAGPPRFTWPMLDVLSWVSLVPSAIAITLVTLAEGLLLSRAYAERNRYRVNPNRDLLAFGLANIAAGAQGAFAMGSSTSRTAAMDQAGSRTQLPSLVVAAGAIALLVFGTALLADIPSPAIGAVVAVAVLPLLAPRSFARLWRIDRFEFAVAGTCFVVTLLVGAIPGVLVAFVLALVNLARRAAHPPIDVLVVGSDRRSLVDEAGVGRSTVPGVVVVRMSAPLFFANAETFAGAVRRAVRAPDETVHDLVLDMEAVTDIDVTAAEAMVGLRVWLEERGTRLSFSRVRPATLARLDALGLRGEATIFPTNRAAVDALGGRPSGTGRRARKAGS
ncbi:SulP family inorganic anion transporter [Homoserinibacter sp. GY 40078]|nr:SulP family inorganic anion transporter [Homoserinibacter sp. GY 40078]